MENFIKPEFLLCEIAIKKNVFDDNRAWIYHTESLSLIEFVYVNDFSDFRFKGKQELFQYKNENYVGVFTQNNCFNLNLDDNIILKNAWNYFKDYLVWEDKKRQKKG